MPLAAIAHHTNKIMKLLPFLFKIDKKPRKGLIFLEWAVLAYVVFTLLLVLFTGTKLANPDGLIWSRIRIAAIVFALWIVYRLVPCRFTMSLRVLIQMVLLAWWYPDTFSLNCIFPNLDHYFATMEETLFGCQPSLLFSKALPMAVFSEIMCFGYSSYYPLIIIVLLFYFFCRNSEFTKASFIVMAAFLLYFAIYDILPIAGPTFYFKAIGLEKASAGVFPAIGDYFNSHTDCFVTPGYDKGIFYFLVESAKAMGERPTAAFPSSHVGIATVCLILALRTHSKKLLAVTLLIYIPLCFSTVYIQAHYVVDALAGLITGVAFYYLFSWIGEKEKIK